MYLLHVVFDHFLLNLVQLDQLVLAGRLLDVQKRNLRNLDQNHVLFVHQVLLNKLIDLLRLAQVILLELQRNRFIQNKIDNLQLTSLPSTPQTNSNPASSAVHSEAN